MSEMPEWWPRNPYPESVFPMPRERYPEIIPDPDTRTALSGMLGRLFWDIASETIWSAWREDQEEMATLLGAAADQLEYMNEEDPHSRTTAILVEVLREHLADA